MPKQVVPIPLLTGQAASGHPFYLGASAQTSRSKNMWIDGRGRVRRRPALKVVSDDGYPFRITGLWDYRYKPSHGRTYRSVVGFSDSMLHASSETRAGMRFGVWDFSRGDFSGFKYASTSSGTRVRLSGDIVDYAGVEFKWGEPTELYWSGSGESDGTIQDYSGEVLADNLDYANLVGSIVLRGEGETLATHNTWRVVGKVSGANVRFNGYTVDPLSGNDVIPSLWGILPSSGVSSGHSPSFTQYGRNLYFTDGGGGTPIKVWTGGSSGASEILQAPRGALLAVHQNRIWVANTKDMGSFMVGCGLDPHTGFPNPYDWDYENVRTEGAVSLNVSAEDQDAITGMSTSHYGDMYIWKANSFHRLSGAVYNNVSGPGAPYTLQTVSKNVGCASARTIVTVGNDVYWMSSHGVHSMSVTEKFGDVAGAYLSYGISSIFDDLNHSRASISQAVYVPGLGLYLLGVPVGGSAWMSKLLAYSAQEKRWMVWDIGEFSAMYLGAPIRGADTVYVAQVKGNFKSKLAILDFEDQVDADYSVQISGATNSSRSASGIECVVEPGDVFVSGDPSVRYLRKSMNRMQAYSVPVGDFSCDVIYSWDSGDEETFSLNLNPRKDRSFETGFTLGEKATGNALGSLDDTSFLPIPISGSGHSFRVRIEDSNPCAFPILHLDGLADIHSEDYTPHPRNN